MGLPARWLIRYLPKQPVPFNAYNFIKSIFYDTNCHGPFMIHRIKKARNPIFLRFRAKKVIDNQGINTRNLLYDSKKHWDAAKGRMLAVGW